MLIYYSITNLAALRLSREQGLFPRWIAVAGLAACLFLAFWVPLSAPRCSTIWKAFSTVRTDGKMAAERFADLASSGMRRAWVQLP